MHRANFCSTLHPSHTSNILLWTTTEHPSNSTVFVIQKNVLKSCTQKSQAATQIKNKIAMNGNAMATHSEYIVRTIRMEDTQQTTIRRSIHAFRHTHAADNEEELFQTITDSVFLLQLSFHALLLAFRRFYGLCTTSNACNIFASR